LKSWAIEPEDEHMSYEVMTAGATYAHCMIYQPCHWWVVWIMEGGGGGTTMNINVRLGRGLSRA
jgi:hypothetical protein